MEEGLLVQSMDSLWFFSSVFSSSKTNPKFQSFEGKTDLEEDPEKPISPIPQSDQNQLQNADSEKVENTESKLGDAVEEEDDQNLEAKKEKLSSRRKRRRRRRKVLGELKLGEFDLRFNYERCNGLGICGIRGNQWGKMPMPPLSDGVAMREHIKCWAHAVACTVR